MATTSGTPSPAPQTWRRWLWLARALALGCWLLVSLAIAFLVGKGMTLPEKALLFSPLWLPFLVVLACVFLMRPERGLAVATGLGTVELCLAVIVLAKPMGLHERLAVAGTVVLTGGLVVTAVKANSALAWKGGVALWRRALRWGAGFLLLQVIVAQRPPAVPRELPSCSGSHSCTWSNTTRPRC